MELKRDSTKNIRSVNWQGIIIVALIAFYTANFGYRVISYSFPDYAQDFLAYWSVGKIADKMGYPYVNDLDQVRSVETEEMIKLGLLDRKDNPNFSPIPASYLSIFLVPFQFLSRIEIQTSAAIWLIINFMMMIAYLLFFFQDLHFRDDVKAGGYFLLLFVVFSYPVFDNFLEGQINVLLMICVGEFVRNAVKGRLFISGVWLAGLLLKLPLLILLLPLLLILRYWKVVFGFLVSSLFLLTASWALSGTEGMIGFTTIMLKAGGGGAASSPQYMINWRMVGILLNGWTASNFGWIVAGLGMLATLVAVFFLVKDRPSFGSDAWVMSIMGVFSATLAFTWHMHIHTAMVMLPLLLATSGSGLLPKKELWVWVLTPVIVWIGSGLFGVLLNKLQQSGGINPMEIAIPLGAFLVNLLLLLAVLRWKFVESATIS